ncbi:arylsulfatase [Tamlana sp. 2_MG-2023]|uniref:arylsulfatase n=1 Tax=unclassified Tamlana TaxID=2614803 RepID=UPI0026E1E866|nr:MULTISPECIES: arylsulfatase [unclassified Tamlana]MDO6760977.1 arylsulfatase [Tamlana sp. 2_MG-2023]MDO6791233.1 arylsulfatase [Tamlana sp. 1_MG-2023]
MKTVIYSLFLIFLFVSCKNKETEQQQQQQQQQQNIPIKKPNIILLLADDMGYGELGSYGQKDIKTPFLDSLASQGMRFTDFYAGTAVCSPSRAVLMTGLHTGHVSIRGNKGQFGNKYDRVPLRKSETIIPEMLKSAGYQSAMIGKWHLGVPNDTSTWAKGRGFDYAVQEQWGKDIRGNEIDERIHWVNNNQDSILYEYNKYKCLDEFRTNFALQFLEDKEDDKPFFLYMSYRTPHANEYEVRKNDLYKDKGFPEYDRLYASRITMLDEQIERLFNTLEQRGELDNTIVIFTSDNGPWTGSHRFKKHLKHSHEFFKSSAGLKGYKRDLYEGGIREPMIVYWEGKIKAGQVTNHPSGFIDIMPTIAEITGAKVPDNIDGISFLPELLNKEQKKHDHLYWEIQEGASVKGFKQAARMGKWKAIRIANSFKTELYDLEKDVNETNDISEQHPEIVSKMNNILKTESEVIEHYPYSGGVFKK